mgnify:CR=1 FL=1
MSWFAIAVLCILILVTLFYLATALYSFWVKLPKWLRITTWVFFIVYSLLAILWFAMMKNVSMLSASMALVIVNLILWIYMLVATKAPKRLKILVWVVACILVVIHIISCFAVPTMYGSVTMNMWVNGL